jgi:CubicO group peptidase (beta-lactamase class C family)
MLGMVIEKLSGRTFIEFCAERLFIPFGLHAVRFGDSRAIVANRATVYTRFRFDTDPPQRLKKPEGLSYETPVFNYPAGGLTISIDDFAKWLAALQSGRIISRQSLSETWKPAVFKDGAARGTRYCVDELWARVDAQSWRQAREWDGRIARRVCTLSERQSCRHRTHQSSGRRARLLAGWSRGSLPGRRLEVKRRSIQSERDFRRAAPAAGCRHPEPTDH